MRKVENVASLHWLGIAFIALCWSDKKGSKVRSLRKSSYSVALLYKCCSNLRKYECSCNPAFSKIQPHVHLSIPVRGDAELLRFILQSRSRMILFQHLRHSDTWIHSQNRVGGWKAMQNYISSE